MPRSILVLVKHVCLKIMQRLFHVVHWSAAFSMFFFLVNLEKPVRLQTVI